jgi:hypothetical protein
VGPGSWAWSHLPLAAPRIRRVARPRAPRAPGAALPSPNGILRESPNGGNDLYVAITRATQRLGVVHLADLPHMLARLRPRMT